MPRLPHDMTASEYSSNAESRRVDSGFGVDGGTDWASSKYSKKERLLLAHMLRLYVEYMH